MKESVKLLFIMNSEDEANLVSNEISKMDIYVEHCMVSTIKMFHEMITMKPWDLIILEREPLEDGYTGLLQHLQNIDGIMPVIVLSEDLQEDDMLTAIKFGCCDYLSKFDYFNIKKVVYRILQNKKVVEVDRKLINLNQILSGLQLSNLYIAVDHSPSMIIITDKHGNFEYVNPKFTVITGYQLQEIAGKNIDNVLQAKETYPDKIKQMWFTLSTGKDWYGEFANKKKNGDIFWVSLSGSAVKDSNGNISNYVFNQEDITEKKKLQHELEIYNKQLLEIVDKLKSTQNQLVQKEKLAGIGQLAAGVAHEINNPLGYVTSNFDTLNNYIKKFKMLLEHYKRLEESIIAKVHNIHPIIRSIKKYEEDNKMEFILSDLNDLLADTNDGLRRIKKIVYDLRQFSRETNEDSISEYDVNSNIENVLLLLNSDISNNAHVVKELGQLPLISARGDELNQVWLNIISNAVYAIKLKYVDKFGTIKIFTYYEEGFIFIIIENDGIGIPEEQLDKIFNPFFTTKPIGVGTGLGLSISYDIIVNKHSGEIMVESNQGEQTKFIMKLPLK
jgi:two-component system, NtrC family, sensor kinase